MVRADAPKTLPRRSDSSMMVAMDRFCTATTLGLAGCLMLAGVAPAATDPLAAHFPADTAAYVRIQLPALAKLADNKAVWTDAKKVQAVVAKLTAMLCLNDGEALGLTAAETAALRSSLRQVSIAWVPQAGGKPTIAAAALLAKADVASQLLATARSRGVLRPVRLGNKEVFQLVQPTGSTFLCQIGAAVVVWTNKARATAMLGGSAKKLSTHGPFQRAAAEPAAAGAIWAWADLKQCGPLWKAAIPAKALWTAADGALKLQEPAFASMGMGGAGPLSRLTTVRLWLPKNNAVLAKWAGAPNRWALAGAIPRNHQLLCWASAEPLTTVLPMLEKMLPPLPAASQPTTRPARVKTTWSAVLADVQEFALVKLPSPKPAPLEQQVTLIVRTKSPQAAATLLGRLDTAVLAATSQPTRRNTVAEGVLGRWLTRNKKLAGVYLLAKDVIILGTTQQAVMATARSAGKGKALADDAGFMQSLKAMGHQAVLLSGPAAAFLDSGPHLASSRSLIQPRLHAVAGIRFFADGIQLQTNLPIPLLLLLAAVDTVR